MYIATKELDYVDGWVARGLSITTAPYEANGPAQAHERALDYIARQNPFLSAMPGVVQVYNLVPLGDPVRLGCLEGPSAPGAEKRIA